MNVPFTRDVEIDYFSLILQTLAVQHREDDKTYVFHGESSDERRLSIETLDWFLEWCVTAFLSHTQPQLSGQPFYGNFVGEIIADPLERKNSQRDHEEKESTSSSRQEDPLKVEGKGCT